MAIKVVIFDLDGVLFNTDKIYFKFLQKTLKEFSIKINSTFYAQNNYDDCIYNLSLSKKTIASIKNKFNKQYYSDKIFDYIKIRKGVLPILQQLSRNLNLAIGSGEEKSQIEKYLDHFSIAKFFTFIGHKTLVEGRKNNPAYFHTITNYYHVKPRECLHVGDNLIDQLALQADISVAIIPTAYSKYFSFDPRCHLLKNIKSLPLFLKRKFATPIT